jgi:hypothetical protein
VQDKNVNLSIYNLPRNKGILEKDLLDYTHAYFPKTKFDSVVVDGNYVFGAKGETYCAFIGTNNFLYKNNSTDDIIQKGKKVFWVSEVSSETQDISFQKFINRVKNNKLTYDTENLYLCYESNKSRYELKFKGDFKVNGKIIDTNYFRYESPYIKANVKDKHLMFKKDEESLFLDFENMIRTF